MKALLSIFLVLLSLTGVAQTEVFEKSVKVGDKRVAIDAELVDQIKVSHWNQETMSVKITYSINQGELNDALEISLDESAGRVKLEVELDKRMIEDADFYDCDKEHSINWNRNGRRNGVCLDVLVEVKVPSGIELDVESVIGDLFIEGSYKEISAKTVTGDIELEWPENQGAEIDIKTVNGAIYTNHEFTAKSDKGLPQISSHKVEANLGNGGSYVSLETVTSDIYFRKLK
ncbi:hypothetical protein [Roseivirga sp.]|uniref:hypothetical protein n=1 Tax=Roseivirga sp. TaxID=1964215 RepID=UPI003B51B88E